MSRLLPILLLAFALVGCPDASPSSDGSPPDVIDATVDQPAAVDVRMDVRTGVDRPADVALDRTDAPVDTADAGCTPDTATPCTCFNGAMGVRTCRPSRTIGYCTCTRPPDADGGTETALPARLLFPLSGTRVTSQRPTLRWVLPPDVGQARVELCQDRACTHWITRQDVIGTSWRSSTALSPGVVFWRVQGLGNDGAVVWTSATWEFQVRHRDTPVDTAYGPLHDFNGDGFDDVVAGTAGSVDELDLFQGTREGIQATASAVLHSPEQSEPLVVNPGFGSDVAVGDINGDGFADLAVAEPSFGYGTSLPSRRFGHVHLYYGGADGLQPSRTQLISVSAKPELENTSQFGGTVALTDFNGDGFDDLMVTREIASRTPPPQPRAYLFLGSALGAHSEPDATMASVFGNILSDSGSTHGLGDVDGDGYGDFAFGVTAPVNTPSVVVLYGGPQGHLDLRFEEITNPGFYRFGRPMYGGDFNGDGFADLLAGSVGYPQVINGSVDGMEAAPRLVMPPLGYPGSYAFGTLIGPQGDLNGDGYTDLATSGACTEELFRPDFECRYGLTYLYASTSAGLDRMWSRFMRTGINDGLGVAGVPGDVNGDGIDDMIIGWAYAGRAGTGIWGGALYVYLGGIWDWAAPSQVVWAERDRLRLGDTVY